MMCAMGMMLCLLLGFTDILSSFAFSIFSTFGLLLVNVWPGWYLQLLLDRLHVDILSASSYRDDQEIDTVFSGMSIIGAHTFCCSDRHAYKFALLQEFYLLKGEQCKFMEYVREHTVMSFYLKNT